MVLEAFISPFRAEKRPLALLFIGFVYTIIALIFSYWVFKQHAGLVSILFIVIASLPLIYKTTRLEEEKDIVLESESSILRQHAHAINFFFFLFLGITLGYTAWYLLMPQGIVEQTFQIQLETIATINGASVSKVFIFQKIFFNNIKVLTFCLLFSFFYGAGAIFVLAWNASVIAVAIGAFFRKTIAQYAHIVGGPSTAVQVQVLSISLLRYSIHGIPEIFAYFIAGLAGGILSFAVVKHDLRSERFEKILLDVSDLLLIALFLVFTAALLETFVTPLFFS